MCGHIAYVGGRDALADHFKGLKRLEDRGYESAGAAVAIGGPIESGSIKANIAALKPVLSAELRGGIVGVGHACSATHGVPTVPLQIGGPPLRQQPVWEEGAHV